MLRRAIVAVPAAVLGALALATGIGAEAPRPLLEARAVIPADTFAPGPISGQHISGGFSPGRNATRPDDTELIVVRMDSLH